MSLLKLILIKKTRKFDKYHKEIKKKINSEIWRQFFKSSSFSSFIFQLYAIFFR